MFRLRLDIGLDGDGRRQQYDATPPPFACAATNNGKGTTTKSTGIDGCPEFEIIYNHECTTFSDMLRDIIETHFMGGHLLDFFWNTAIFHRNDILMAMNEEKSCMH